jgi:hypothetical protein
MPSWGRNRAAPFPSINLNCTQESLEHDIPGDYDRNMELLEIPNDQLKLSDVPAPEADWDTIAEFGLTFNGRKELGSIEACAKIMKAQRHETLRDLRVCLFYEVRRLHLKDGPGAEDIERIRGIVDLIRERVDLAHRL